MGSLSQKDYIQIGKKKISDIEKHNNIEHNKRVVAEVMDNNSPRSMDRRQKSRLERNRMVATSALKYIQEHGRGDHESNHKLIEQVKKYYGGTD